MAWGASLPALSEATLVWQAEEWETNPSLGGHPSLGAISGGGGGGGGGGDSPFFQMTTRNGKGKRQPNRHNTKVSNQA